MFLRYNELRAFVGDPSATDAGRSSPTAATSARPRPSVRPRDWIGTATEAQLDFPYWVNWGFPEKFHREASTDVGEVAGIAGSPGVVEGIARVVRTVARASTRSPRATSWSAR